MTQRAGYPTISPYLVCKNASSALDYYKKHFSAVEHLRLNLSDDLIVHAEMTIGNARIMISDEMPDMDILSPLSMKSSPVSFVIYIDNPDKVFDDMSNDGSTPIMPIQDQFHGDRSGKIRDPFGHIWVISTNLEAQTPTEINYNFKKMMPD